MVHRRFYVTVLLVTVLALPAIAQTQAELSPAVNVHCSNTILRAYGSSTDDAKLISDQELEDLSNELSEVCKPVPGWTTKDQLYRALAMNGVLSERLLRSMTSNTEHMQEATRLYAEVKALRSENERLRAQTKKDPSH